MKAKQTDTEAAVEQAQQWADELGEIAELISNRFSRTEARERAVNYLRGLLSTVERKNSWQLAMGDGFVRIDEEIRPGDRVIVKDGPLRNFAGIFEREMKGTDRIRILLETVSHQAHTWNVAEFRSVEISDERKREDGIDQRVICYLV